MADQPKRVSKSRDGHREPKDRGEGREGRENSGRNSSLGGRHGDRERARPPSQARGDAAAQGGREHRERGEARRDKENAKQQGQQPSDDPEAWLDCVIADCNDAAPPTGRDSSRREKIPKRPSSRADSRPKGEGDAFGGGHRGDPAERPARPPDDQKAQRPPAAPPTNATADGKVRSAAPQKEVPLTRVASEDEIQADGRTEATRTKPLVEQKAKEYTSTDDIEQEKFKEYAKQTAKGLAKGHDTVAQSIYSFLKKVLAAPNLEKPVKSNFAPFEFKTNGRADEIERIVVDFNIHKKGTIFTVSYKSRHSILSSEEKKPKRSSQQQQPQQQQPAPPQQQNQQQQQQAPVVAQAPAAPKPAERPAPVRTENITSPKRKANGPVEDPVSPSHIEEDIQAPEESNNKKKKEEEEEIDEEVDYDDDFEEEDGEDEEYVPKAVMKTVSPTPDAQAIAAASRNIVRPESMQGARAMSPPVIDASKKDPNAMNDIKKAMEAERQKAQRKQAPAKQADQDLGPQKGFLANYTSTMPRFNLGAGSASEKAALQRIRDLKKLKVLDRRTVESVTLFQQRAQTQHALFLSGKSVKYSQVRTAGTQTGEDDLEAGVNTDDIWTDDKDQQFPTLNMSATQADSEPSQMLAFLRRTLPLFEASMGEATQRRPGAAAQVGMDTAGNQAVSNQAVIGLPERFFTRFIAPKESISITDVSICPEWYGADHALVLYNWPWRPRPFAEGSSQLDRFTRPLQSLMGLYPILSSSSSSSGAAATGASLQSRPARCLFAFCRLSSLVIVSGRPHLIIAGSEMGSLMVWDLRNKPHSPGDDSNGQIRDSDEDIAHFEGPIWLGSAFSTDSFAFDGNLGEKDEVDFFSDDSPSVSRKPVDASSQLHSCELSCVRCSDVVGGDALILALDLAGTVSFWRLLELTGQASNVKLALQGCISLAAGGGPKRSLCGGFLDACYACIHPQQQAHFVVLSTSGLRQVSRQSSSSVADGPDALTLGVGGDDLLYEEGEELAPLRGGAAQPCSAAFNPFFPGLLLVAYAGGDLALFDCALCVPVTHWGGAVANASDRQRPLSVAWSTVRPCVFFVKACGALDVWDLADRAYAPVLTVDVASHVGPPSASSSAMPSSAAQAVCSEIYVSPTGHPVVGHGPGALVLRLPPKLTTPLQAAPPQHMHAVVPVDSLLRGGYEKASLFPTLERYKRDVDVPQYAALERDVMRTVVAGIHPLQAWA